MVTKKQQLRSVNPDQKMWHRSEDVLDLLTLGQVQMMKGESMQNPYYLSQGCSIMLEIIVPLLKEQVTDTETKRTTTLRGFQTHKAKDFYDRLAAARHLISIGMDKSISNHRTALDMSYKILSKLKKEVLQTTNDLEFNFMRKPDPYDAWKGG